jgi:hypothetical protein
MELRKNCPQGSANFSIGFVDKMDQMVVTLGEIFLEMKILKFCTAKIGEISHFRGNGKGDSRFNPTTDP